MKETILKHRNKINVSQSKLGLTHLAKIYTQIKVGYKVIGVEAKLGSSLQIGSTPLHVNA